jgi:hypothetical protein
MTPKEEAKELVRKYFIFGIKKEGQTLSLYECNKCALIAVDEILKVAFYATDEIYEHYLQVKTEIDKL